MADLRDLVTRAFDEFAGLGEEVTSERPAPGKWSAKEILGHLIDSAANNHARFVRMAGENNLSFPPYDQDAWVALQGWQEQAWADVLAFWSAYNLHLARVIERLPSESLNHRAKVGTLGDDVTLGWVVEHYVEHLQHHLGQIRTLIGVSA